MSALPMTPTRQRLRKRLAVTRGEAPVLAVLPYTHYLIHNANDGLWYVTCRIVATGQSIRCGYYQRPADHQVPVIAERLYGLRKRDEA